MGFASVDVLGEAWQTADELLSNLQRLEAILEARQAVDKDPAKDGQSLGSSSSSSQASGAATEQHTQSDDVQDWEVLWARQHRLWCRSEELHKECNELSLSKP